MVKPARFRTARRQRRWRWARAKWAVLLALLLGLWLFRSERETRPEALEPVDLTFRLCGEAGSGGTEPPRDRYGRELREARRGEDLLAEHMIAAGLAEGMGWGAERVEWC